MKGVIGAFLGALGFGLMYHLSGKKLWWTALCGGVGQFICLLVSRWTDSAMAPMLVAAFCVNSFAEILARRLKAPVIVFLVCALIPLVPGKGIYEALLCCLSENGASMEAASKTLLEASGIVAGCAISSWLFYRKSSEE
ncbi:threonine/serine exporter family protein [Dubosiella newyorkensis]|nr:threonine/serine exporter family protein [Dubosiella newyorkensis]